MHKPIQRRMPSRTTSPKDLKDFSQTSTNNPDFQYSKQWAGYSHFLSTRQEDFSSSPIMTSTRQYVPSKFPKGNTLNNPYAKEENSLLPKKGFFSGMHIFEELHFIIHTFQCQHPFPSLSQAKEYYKSLPSALIFVPVFGFVLSSQPHDCPPPPPSFWSQLSAPWIFCYASHLPPGSFQLLILLLCPKDNPSFYFSLGQAHQDIWFLWDYFPCKQAGFFFLGKGVFFFNSLIPLAAFSILYRLT